MRSHRTTARGVLFLLLAPTLAAAASAAPRAKSVPQIIFPVVGEASYTDDFGDARPGGPHQGIDILAPRKAIAVAAESGKVKLWTTSASAGCMLYLYGDSGTTYLYIHLNNDLGSGNDNKGKCVAGSAYAPGLRSGSRVEAGQQVGFVGDSGDADGIHPHLHFEVHPNGAKATDPYPYLKTAQKLLFWAPLGSKFRLVLYGRVVSTLGGFLDLRVGRVVGSPMKLTIPNLGRNLYLSVPADAKVEQPIVGIVPISTTLLTQPAKLTSAKRGQRAVVWTSPAPTTLEAMRGDDDVLSAALIQLG
jgi:hypothetical protein